MCRGQLLSEAKSGRDQQRNQELRRWRRGGSGANRDPVRRRHYGLADLGRGSAAGSLPRRLWIVDALDPQRLAVVARDLPSSPPICRGSASRRPRPSRIPPKGLRAFSSRGSTTVLPRRERLHLAGFSFGGVLGGHVAAQLGDRVRAFTVVGSNGLGLIRQPTDLQRVPPGASGEEALAVHRHNLGALMIADTAKIDELAVYVQYDERAARPGQEPPVLARGHAGAGVAAVTARLDGIWGGRDATAYPHLDERARTLRSFQPEARFEVIDGAGHWVQYEAADRSTRFSPKSSTQRRRQSP